MDDFLKICTDFKSNNPEKLIGIHCTHGINRTGFMICSYLTQILHYSPDVSVEMFKNSRPPGILKKQFIDCIYRRYGTD